MSLPGIGCGTFRQIGHVEAEHDRLVVRFLFPVGGEDERPSEVFQQKYQGLPFHFVRILVLINRGGYDADRARVDRCDVNLLPDRSRSGDIVDGVLVDIRLILE